MFPFPMLAFIRFPGQYFDEETGLHYNRFRYYDPGIGRYVSADPLGQNGGHPNLYGYVAGKPINRTDPSGEGGRAVAVCVAIGVAATVAQTADYVRISAEIEIARKELEDLFAELECEDLDDKRRLEILERIKEIDNEIRRKNVERLAEGALPAAVAGAVTSWLCPKLIAVPRF